MQRHCARTYLLLGFSLLLLAPSRAQQPPSQSSPTHDLLTNNDVVKMLEAKLSDETIISKIQTSACSFDTSVDAILRLKSAGLSDELIKAMVAKTPAREASAPAPPPDPNDPRAPHASGIYWLAKQGPATRMVRLEPSSHPGQKARPGFGTANVKAVLPGQHATLRISGQSPEFWFYIDEKSAGLGEPSSAAAKPEDFTLARMNAGSKERQLVVGHASAFGGLTSGVRPEDSLQVDIQKVGPGVYRVSPLKPLVAGEYCFVPSGAAGSFVSYGGRLFDFGIDK